MDVNLSASQVAAHDLELQPNEISSVTFDAAIDRVEIRYDGTADIYYTRNGTPPAIGGRECYRLPKGPPGIDSKEMGGECRTLRFISAEPATISVLRDD